VGGPRASNPPAQVARDGARMDGGGVDDATSLR
jgi:hypothetical protein